MHNLIIANVIRLFKSKVFRIAFSLIICLGFYEIITIYLDYKSGNGTPYFETALFSIAAIGLFALAAIVSIYIGSEYSDGTLRNKVIIGHTRRNIYLSNLITSIIASVLLVLGWSIAYSIPGLLLMKSGNPLSMYLVMYAGLFFVMVVFSSIFTMITTFIGNKAASSVICLLLTLVFLMHGIVVNSILEEPEYYSPGIRILENGNTELEGEPIPNPNYLPEGSPKRKAYEFMLDFVPGGQALQIAGFQSTHVKDIVLYDIVWIVLINTSGIIIFDKKDLK